MEQIRIAQNPCAIVINLHGKFKMKLSIDHYHNGSHSNVFRSKFLACWYNFGATSISSIPPARETSGEIVGHLCNLDVATPVIVQRLENLLHIVVAHRLGENDFYFLPK